MQIKNWESILLVLLLGFSFATLIPIVPIKAQPTLSTIVIYRSADANAVNALIAKFHSYCRLYLFGTELAGDVANNNVVLVGGWLALPTYYAQYFPQLNSRTQLKYGRYLIAQVTRTGGSTVTVILGWTAENTLALCMSYPSYPPPPHTIVIYS